MHLYHPSTQTHTRSITGLFWMMPKPWQRERVRDLLQTQRFSVEQVATICREPLSTIRTLMEVPQ